MATASAAVGAMAAAAVDNGLAVPSSGNRSRSSSDSSPNEWQDIRDLLSLSSITGLKPLSSGSSDPGSPSSSVGGVRNKRSSGDNSSLGNSNRFPKLFLNSSQGTVADGVKSNNNQQLQPSGNVMKTGPVQIQLRLLAGTSTDIHQPTRPRRYSLERFGYYHMIVMILDDNSFPFPSFSNDSLRGKASLTDNQQAPDVLPTTSGVTTGGTRINSSLAVPEFQGKTFPVSPSASGKRKTSHGKFQANHLFPSIFFSFIQYVIPLKEGKMLASLFTKTSFFVLVGRAWIKMTGVDEEKSNDRLKRSSVKANA